MRLRPPPGQEAGAENESQWEQCKPLQCGAVARGAWIERDTARHRQAAVRLAAAARAAGMPAAAPCSSASDCRQNVRGAT